MIWIKFQSIDPISKYLWLDLLYIHYYRDQNFGLNELAAIQDVRNEYNLQDITDEPPSASQTTNDRGKSRKIIVEI